jgi:hypothetical protein
VVAIHYPLTEHTQPDPELRRYALERLNRLLAHIEPLLEAEEAQAKTDAPTVSPT